MSISEGRKVPTQPDLLQVENYRRYKRVASRPERRIPEATFRQQALAYAAEIANGPSQALARMKYNLNAGLTQSLGDSLQLEAQHLVACSGGEEAKEAISAFTNKRTPEFHKS